MQPDRAAMAGSSPDRHRLGTMVCDFPSIATVRIAQAAGADFVCLDTEHGSLDGSAMRDVIGVCRALGLDAFVRVPAGETSGVSRALDAGASGILAAMVSSAAEAERLVTLAKFPPIGRRGTSFVSAHDDYRPGDKAEKLQEANKRTSLLCMIETPEGVALLSDILAVSGIDGCWFGYLDLSSFLGIPGRTDDPLIRGAARQIARESAAVGKVCGVMVTSREEFEAFAALGFSLFAWGSDATVMRTAYAAAFDLCRAPC